LMIVFNQGTLTLKDSDGDGCLLVLVGSEGLRLLGRNDSTALYDRGHDSANSLNAKRKWSNINEKNILGFFSSLTSEDASLDCCSIGNSLVWVYTAVRFLSIKVFFEQRLNLWNTC